MLKILQKLFPKYFYHSKDMEENYKAEQYRQYWNKWFLIYGGLILYLLFSFLFGVLVNAKEPMFPIEYKKPEKLVFIKEEVNLEKLAYAISMQETRNCKLGVGKTHNNCFGIKENGKFVRFESKERPYHSFFYNWKKHYNNEFPKKWHAIKWSGNDRAKHWLDNVNYFYNL